MIKCITHFLIIFLIFQQLKSQISKIDQHGYNPFCDETLHLKVPRSDHSFQCYNQHFIQLDPTIFMLDKMLNTTCRKSGHSSALLNVNLTFQFLERSVISYHLIKMPSERLIYCCHFYYDCRYPSTDIELRVLILIPYDNNFNVHSCCASSFQKLSLIYIIYPKCA